MVRRVHRTFLERFAYLAIYRCRQCQHEQYVPRHYRLHFGPHVRCPRCGTLRLVRLKERDRIDGMQRGLMNLAERLAGGKLYHCKICRLQFYDRRTLAPAAPPVGAAAPPAEDQQSQPMQP